MDRSMASRMRPSLADAPTRFVAIRVKHNPKLVGEAALPCFKALVETEVEWLATLLASSLLNGARVWGY